MAKTSQVQKPQPVVLIVRREVAVELFRDNPNNMIQRMNEASSWGEARRILADEARKQGLRVKEVAV